jgi:hypothetical protein
MFGIATPAMVTKSLKRRRAFVTAALAKVNSKIWHGPTLHIPLPKHLLMKRDFFIGQLALIAKQLERKNR